MIRLLTNDCSICRRADPMTWERILFRNCIVGNYTFGRFWMDLFHSPDTPLEFLAVQIRLTERRESALPLKVVSGFQRERKSTSCDHPVAWRQSADNRHFDLAFSIPRFVSAACCGLCSHRGKDETRVHSNRRPERHRVHRLDASTMAVLSIHVRVGHSRSTAQSHRSVKIYFQRLT